MPRVARIYCCDCLIFLPLSLVMCDNRLMETYRANEARLKMRDILTAVERGEHVQIQRYDTPTAIVVPVEWYEHQRAALAAFADAGNTGDPPVSACEVREQVVTLSGLLDGMRKYVHPEIPASEFAHYWDCINKAVVKLADLLPENAEGWRMTSGAKGTSFHYGLPPAPDHPGQLLLPGGAIK